MELLDQARKEVEAIEATLGENVAGSETDLVTRLARRLSSSGIPRGLVVPLREPNASVGTIDSYGYPDPPENYYNRIHDWNENDLVRAQFGYTSVAAYTANPWVWYGTIYGTNVPRVIIAQYVPTVARTGVVQVNYGGISTSGFPCRVRAWDSTGGFTTPDADYYVVWMAVGGA